MAYRKSQKFESDSFALSAWLREGELQAAEITCAPYNEAALLDAFRDIRPLTRSTRRSGGLRAVLCRGGSRRDRHVRGREANGATRWLAPHKAIIQLSLRYRWEDIFWFTFFHEAGHLVLHRKKEVFVEVGPNDRSTDPHEQQLEDEADRFASRTLIPPPHDQLLSELTLDEVPLFAKSLDIAPAIVVGRLQHEGHLGFSRGNTLRRRLKLADSE